MKALKSITPDLSLQWINEEWNWSRPGDQQRYFEAFRIAGLRWLLAAGPPAL